MGDGLGHLRHAVALLTAGVADVGNQLRDFQDFSDGLLHRLARMGRLDIAFMDFSHAVADELLDLFGRFCAATCQGTYFASHHRKATAMLASARRFHGGIECQDVGLEGDAINHPNDVGNLFAAGVDALHGLHHFAHRFAPLGDHALRFAGELVCRLRMLGVVGHGRAQLLHGCRRFLQRAGFAFSAGGQVHIGLGNFRAGHGHAVRLLIHGTHHTGQPCIGVVHRIQQMANFILARAVNVYGQVTFGNRVCHAAGFIQRTHDHAANQPEPDCRQHQHSQQPHDRKLDDEAASFSDEFVGVGTGCHHPIPRCIVPKHRQLFTGLGLSRVHPRVGAGALLALQHVADKQGAIAVFGITDVAAFLHRVHHQLTTLGAVFRAQHIVVARVAHLQRAHRGFEVVEQLREVLPDKCNAHRLACGIFQWPVVRHVLAPKQLRQSHIALSGLDGGIGGMAAVQHSSHRCFTLVIFQSSGNAQEVCIALGCKDSGHGTGTACESLQVRDISIEWLAIEVQQGFAARMFQAQCALQIVGQAIRQELGALAQIFVIRFNKTQQHVNALLHLAVHFGLQGLAHAPGNRKHQQAQNGSNPHKIGDRQLDAQALAAPKTLADVHEKSPYSRRGCSFFD